MFSRLTVVTSLALLSILAVATPNPENAKRWATTTTPQAPTTTVTVTETATASSVPASDCSTGSVQCCNTVTSASDPTAAGILGLLGVVVQGVDVLVGLTCDPITVVGAGGGSCSAQAVCCQDNSYGSLISIGCIPVTL
ncbi:uncharacterized protein PHACADRAFT_98288 [Phanerochaete carnosa HHB-10118-sp]|uniref:Hydrophobin n=1 Tax=Phanerochaete carnosa (strain HHB-10118-sp) TaxID=650164 RepID=K5UVT3_PHACS|nr:uncharacterized protein PHACADRAFT_98288 [Phanerochaete carnosa HHB-10118-sp]EKM54146.1 hypothetical protein PHACADRAFT_98288 [Phanerochaete carnosa HHB-10118-sp]